MLEHAVAEPPAELSLAPLPPLPRLPLAMAWAVFWLLQLTVGVQDHLREGRPDVWKPLLWEGTSFAVATVIMVWQVRRTGRHDALLTRPWRWFAANLAWLPLLAPLFVAVVYGLRHGVYSLAGETYRHASWGQTFGYESAKFAMFYLLFVAIAFGIRSHAALGAERLRVAQARALSRQAQLMQLAQQIEPHFLFNALNTIASAIHSDPELADALLTRLAALLRAATDLTRRPEASLDEELQLAEGYGAIMRERFADRVTLRFEIEPEARICRLPALALQPLIENAFRHVVERRAEATTIVVRARCGEGRLILSVEDDGGELPADVRFGVGLSNLQQRLATLHGNAAKLSLTVREGGGVAARIELPCGC